MGARLRPAARCDPEPCLRVSPRPHAVAFRIRERLPRADFQSMTSLYVPEFVQPNIVLSDARKDVLASALKHARNAMEATPLTPWQPFVQTAAEQSAYARAERLAWLIESM